MSRFFISGKLVWGRASGAGSRSFLRVLSRPALVAAMVLSHAGANAMKCELATNLVEKKICASPVLNDLDAALNSNYTGMIHSDIGDGARSFLRSSQRQWLKKRNACKSENCLLSLYVARVDEVCEMPVISGIHAICITSEAVLNRHGVSLPRTDIPDGVAK